MYKKTIQRACFIKNLNVIEKYIYTVKYNSSIWQNKRIFFYFDAASNIILPTRTLLRYYDLGLLNNNYSTYLENLKNVSDYIQSQLTVETLISKKQCKILKRPVLSSEININNIEKLLLLENNLCIDTEFYFPWDKKYISKDYIHNTYEFGYAYYKNKRIYNGLFKKPFNKTTNVKLENILFRNKIKNILFYGSSNDKKFCQFILNQNDNIFNYISYINVLPIFRKCFPNAISCNLEYLFRVLYHNTKYITKLNFHTANYDAKILLLILKYIQKHYNKD